MSTKEELEDKISEKRRELVHIHGELEDIKDRLRAYSRIAEEEGIESEDIDQGIREAHEEIDEQVSQVVDLYREIDKLEAKVDL